MGGVLRTWVLLTAVVVGLCVAPPAWAAEVNGGCRPLGSAEPVPWQLQAVGNVAHKGQSALAPENTLEAARQATAQRADFIGIDVRRTRDGRLVVLHDATLRRTTDVESVFPRRRDWPVDRFTLDEIRRLDAGSWHSAGYTGERVPTLGEMLLALRSSRTGLFLEIKDPSDYGGVGGIGRQVVRSLVRHSDWLSPDGPDRRLVIQAFDDAFIRDFAARYPRIPVSMLGPAWTLQQYADAGADQVNVNHADVTPELVRAAHDLCMAVSSYVVNDAPTMRRLVGAEVDAISTDRPALLARVLRSWEPESRAMADAPTPAAPVSATMAVRTPVEALLGSRVPVRVKVRGVDGSRARFSWVRVQLRASDRWVTLQRRVTNRYGNLSTSVAVRPRMGLRIVSERSDWFSAARQRRSVSTRRPASRIRLYGDGAVARRQRAVLHVRWRTELGHRVTGGAELLARPSGRRWRAIRTVRVERGEATVRLRPRRSTRYELRGRGGRWWLGDRDRHWVEYRGGTDR